MTKQQHLDEAAKAAGYPDWGSAALMHPTEPMRVLIEKCATTLEALAERDRVLGEIARMSAPENMVDGYSDIYTLAAPYRAKVDQDAEDLKALCAVWLGADYPRLEDGETWPAALAKFREIVAQRGEVK